MNRAQFKRLTDVFWKSANETQLNDTFTGYEDALGDLPPNAVDKAVHRALREAKEMPKPVVLREWATAWIPRSTYTRLEGNGPCSHCDASFAEAENPDGTGRRFYVVHRHSCPQPSFSKPDHKVFTDWMRDPRISTPMPTAKREVNEVHTAVTQSLTLPLENAIA